MKQVILTKGLPASGKTTWAKGMVQDNPGQYKRVNKDELRAMLDVGRWSKHNEQFVLNMRDQMILAALEDGKHVIVDDTNLHPRHEARIKQLVKGKAQVRIQDFTDVDVEECIKRDLLRIPSVGERVIRKMWRDFVAEKDPVRYYSEALPHAILVDLDGTLCLLNGRNPYDASTCENDLPNPAVLKVVTSYPNWGQQTHSGITTKRVVIFLSGRMEKHRPQTEMWLKGHDLIGDLFRGPFMRADGDTRKDSVVKKELFDKHIRGRYNIDFVLDDRQQVVDMWRVTLGLTVLQVDYGDF